jgi:hypothetical protein
MVDRIHRDAAVVRTPAHPPVAAGLADRHVLVLEVADLTDRRVTLDVHLADLARGQAHLRVGALAGHQLRGRAGRAHELAALAAGQLDVVDRCAEGDRPQRQRVARQDVRGRDRRRPWRRPAARWARGCSASRRPRSAAARCAPCGSGRTRSTRPSPDVLLVAAEVDDAVEALVAAAHEPRGRPPLVVAAARRAQADGEALLGPRGRQLLEVELRLEPHAGGGRFELFDRHYTPSKNSIF